MTAERRRGPRPERSGRGPRRTRGCRPWCVVRTRCASHSTCSRSPCGLVGTSSTPPSRWCWRRRCRMYGLAPPSGRPFKRTPQDLQHSYSTHVALDSVRHDPDLNRGAGRFGRQWAPVNSQAGSTRIRTTDRVDDDGAKINEVVRFHVVGGCCLLYLYVWAATFNQLASTERGYDGG